MYDEQLSTGRGRCAVYVVLFGLVVAVGYCLLKWQHSIESKEAQSTASNHIEHVYRNLNELSGVISSLSTLYNVTLDIGDDELDYYNDDLVKSSPWITSIARFDRIESGNISRFAEEMMQRGIYRFEIKEMQPDGSLIKSGPSPEHNALVNINPFQPETARLIGVDITADTKLSDAISSSVSANEVILTEYPEGWPRTGNVLLVLPTYLGRSVPRTVESREMQYDGGYLVQLSIADYLTAADGVSTHISAPGFTLNTCPEENNRFLTGIFKGYSTALSPKIGLSRIHLTVKSPDGVSKGALLKALALTALCLVPLIYVVILLRSRRSAQSALDNERKIAVTTLEAINDSVFTVAKDGEIAYMNPAAEAMLGNNARHLVGSTIRQSIPFIDDETCSQGLDEIEHNLCAGSAVQLNEMELSVDTVTTQVDCAFTPFDAPASVGGGGVLVMRDVGKERALTRKLEHLATHDNLTGLVNRYYFELRLKEAVDGAAERGEQHAVCYIDLDQFKVINDTVGHNAGDKLLIQVAENLKANCREEDVLARLGGDEFGLLILNVDSDHAENIAKRLHQVFQTFYFKHLEHAFSIRASIGHVGINSEYFNITDVLAAADIACYSAKDMGRNSLHIFRPECLETSERQDELAMLPKLQNALEVDKFVLFVQPIARILPGGIDATAKYEILLRMEDDDGSLITPFRLISAAERYDLMKDIDKWVINRALRHIADLKKDCGNNLPMFSINISGQSAVDPELGEYLLSKLQETGVAPNKICIEITETSAMGDLTRAQRLLEFLHEIGCMVALDDFGAGECSFGYLKSLPVDYLKIDGQFVKDVDTCDVRREMLRFCRRVASLLEIETVAEFVENESILECLREMGINYAQGYHISKPFNITELHQQLAEPLDEAA